MPVWGHAMRGWCLSHVTTSCCELPPSWGWRGGSPRWAGTATHEAVPSAPLKATAQRLGGCVWPRSVYAIPCRSPRSNADVYFLFRPLFRAVLGSQKKGEEGAEVSQTPPAPQVCRTPNLSLSF